MFIPGESGGITGRLGNNGGNESAPRRFRRLDVVGVVVVGVTGVLSRLMCLWFRGVEDRGEDGGGGRLGTKTGEADALMRGNGENTRVVLVAGEGIDAAGPPTVVGDGDEVDASWDDVAVAAVGVGETTSAEAFLTLDARLFCSAGRGSEAATGLSETNGTTMDGP